MPGPAASDAWTAEALASLAAHLLRLVNVHDALFVALHQEHRAFRDLPGTIRPAHGRNAYPGWVPSDQSNPLREQVSPKERNLTRRRGLPSAGAATGIPFAPPWMRLGETRAQDTGEANP